MKTLHLVSHTHWDREWYLTFQQFRLKLVHLIDGLLDILEHDRNFKYFMLDGQTIVLDDYLAIRPEREADLRRYIKNGRILIGPWHILPDEFLVSPEATIRNLLQGERTTKKFGPKMTVGYIPDPFGHIGQMPQILRGFGIETAAFRRGLSDEPCELWWEAPDGSRVFVAYLRDGYDNAAGLPTSEPERFASEVRRLRDNLLPHTASSHLLLMQGTDHMQPPPDTSAAIASARSILDGDKLVHSTLPQYLKAVQSAIRNPQSAIPTVVGELRSPKRHHLLPGVLSARMWIKQRNQACETLLEKWAEPFSLFASLTTNHRPQTFILQPSAFSLQAWRLLMENHPHDSICGCSIDQVHDEMKVRFDQVEQIGEEITKQSLETLATAVDTQSAIRNQQLAIGRPSISVHGLSSIIVLNPASTPRTDLAAFEVSLPLDVSDFEILDEAGNVIPHETKGLGSRDLINVSLDRVGLGGIIGSLHDGRISNLSIQELDLRRAGDIIHVKATLSESGAPNAEAWQRGVEAMKTYLADPSVATFQIRARTSDAAAVTFTAPNVPGLGWRTFWVHSKPAGPPAALRIPPFARPFLPLAARLAPLFARQKTEKPPIENEFFHVDVARDGTLNLLDKRTGTVYRGLNRFVDGGDCGDEYNYCPPVSDRVAAARLKSVSITRGSVQQTLRLDLELKTPAELTPDRKSRARQVVPLRITSHITLTNGVPRVDVRTTVNNTARDHRLRVHFPAPFAVTHADHDGHFEIVRRPIGVPEFDKTWVEDPRPEVPQRAFTTVGDGSRGLTIANRGLPEVEVIGVRSLPTSQVEIALTLLRCVGWLSRDDFANRKGHAGPFLPTPGAQMIGKWTFDYSIIPHEVGRDSIPPYEHAYAFEAPLRAVITDLHDGALPTCGSFVEVSPREFVISAVKEAEDGRGWLVRGYNITRQPVQVTLRPWRKFRHVERVNLAEEKVGGQPVARDGRITFAAGKHEIVTLLFRDNVR